MTAAESGPAPLSNATDGALASSDLLQLVLEVSGSLDARTVIENVLRRSLAMTAADRATLSSISPMSIRIEASVGPEEDVQFIDGEYSLDYIAQQPLVAEMLRRRVPITGGTLNVEGSAPAMRTALARTRHSAMIPLIHGDVVTGMLAMSRYDDRPFTSADMPALTAIGSVGGLALRNAKLYETATTANQRLHSVIAAASELATASDSGALLGRIVMLAADAAGASSASIGRVEGEESIVEATSGRAIVGSHWPMPAAVRDQLARGEHVELTIGSLPLTDAQRWAADRYGPALLMPLRLDDELLGVLFVVRDVGGLPFEPEDAAGLQQFGTLTALLLRNARLIETVRAGATAKRELIDIAVHEMRAPLTVIEGYTSMMQDGSLGEINPQTARALESIRAKSSEARRLAADLLTMARVESDDLPVSLTRIAVDDLLRAAAHRAQPQADLLGGSVTLEGATGLFVMIESDLCARIIDNLLANALAYAGDRPRVRIVCRSVDSRVEIDVCDSGPGIPEDERERVFERFARGRAGLGTSGSGIGLYVSRASAVRMGGTLAIVDSDAAGCVMQLTLPAAA